VGLPIKWMISIEFYCSWGRGWVFSVSKTIHLGWLISLSLNKIHAFSVKHIDSQLNSALFIEFCM